MKKTAISAKKIMIMIMMVTIMVIIMMMMTMMEDAIPMAHARKYKQAGATAVPVPGSIY